MAITLLLLGRTGNGKSSTGNAILGPKHFQPRSPGQDIIVDIKLETSKIESQEITVVDGSGIGDANLNDNKGVKKTIEYVERTFVLCPNGFNAVVLVLKCGERFTNQEVESIRLIKGILGNKIMETHGVIVMTYGDNFGVDEDEGNLTFEDWCHQQDGLMAEMFQECEYRCVLFNNRAKDEKTTKSQRKRLTSVVADLASKVKTYTMEDYNNAEEDRHRLLVASYIPILEMENRKVLDSIVNEIRQIDMSGERDYSSVISGLEDRFNSHKVWLDKQTKGIGIPINIQLQCDVTNTALQNKKSILNIEQEIRKQKKHSGKKQNKEKDVNRKGKGENSNTDNGQHRAQPSTGYNTDNGQHRAQPSTGYNTVNKESKNKKSDTKKTILCIPSLFKRNKKK